MRSARRPLRLGSAAALLAMLTACSGGGASPTAHSAPRTPRSTTPPTSHPTPSPSLTTPNLPTEQASVEPEPTVGRDVDLRHYLLRPPPGASEEAGDSGADHWLTVAEIAKRDAKNARAARGDRTYMRDLGLTGAAVVNWANVRQRTFVTVEIERFPSPAVAYRYRGDQTNDYIAAGYTEPGLLLPPHTILYVDPRRFEGGMHEAIAQATDHNLMIIVIVNHIGKALPALARRVSQQQVRGVAAAFGAAT